MIELRRLEVEQGTVHCYEAGSGPDLVFLHDASGVSETHPLVTRLAERFHVLAPLLPGYGQSDEAPGIRDMLDVTLHSLDVLDALGLSRPILVGHSLGGMIAAEMAALAPKEIDRLCLIAPAGLWLDEHPIPDLFSTLPYQLPALLFHDAEAGAAMMAAGRKMDDPGFLIQFLVQNARQLGMAGKFLFPIPERGLARRLHRIRARTLLVWGTSDRVVPLAYASAFQAGIREAEIVRIPEAGHMVTWEKPDAVTAALARLI
jgi:pimeloyl-ACP methyl ester carboxylesterase